MRKPLRLFLLLFSLSLLPLCAHADTASDAASASLSVPASTAVSTSTVDQNVQTEAAPPSAAPAAPAPATQTQNRLDSGNTAWMLAATALVLMMTIPGLALFYAGMVRKKNALATMMQSFAVTALVSVLWMVAGYSLAFTEGTPFIGSLDRFMLDGMELHSLSGTPGANIPESVFMMFQMTFAIITPALIAGAFAERMKFSALLWFMGLWSLGVYAPVAHWVWGPHGWLLDKGILDYAGGTVVHINAGFAGLAAAIVLGKRVGFGSEPMAPHNLTLTITGAALLWVGWFGFNAGSAVAADERAGMAMAVTQIATAAAALAWMFAEWLKKGKASVLGIASGAVAGLVAVTPASGFVAPGGALIIGIAAGVICYWSATTLKRLLGMDDSLDAFGVHGIGGVVGAVLTGILAAGSIGGTEGSLDQVVTQLIGVGATLVYSTIGSLIILKLVDIFIGLRVSEDEERAGLDIALHGEHID